MATDQGGGPRRLPSEFRKRSFRARATFIDLDLRSYFDTVRHDIVLKQMAKRIRDDDVMHLVKMILRAAGKRGVPQGGVISPMLSNLYLNEVDRMLERAREVTRHGQWTAVEYVRFADDLVVLVDTHPRHRWLRTAVERRLREELAALHLSVNEDKTRRVDLTRGGSFAFLGFEFRRVRSSAGRWMALRVPRIRKRTALLRELRAWFRRYRSQPIVTPVGSPPTEHFCLLWTHYRAII